MRTAEESSGTVLHRLIQEQLRYGNPTDTRTLLAIQRQALRGGSSNSSSSSSTGGGGGEGGGGTGSPLSSLENLTQEETQYIQMSTRQEPQGQEHQGDYKHLETACDSQAPACHLYQVHGEELPTYEEAKAHSLYLASRRAAPQLLQGPPPPPQSGGGEAALREVGGEGPGLWERKREHARSLSERLMRLSLERSGGLAAAEEEKDALESGMSSSHSYPLLAYQGTPVAPGPGESPYGRGEERGPPPDYPFLVPAPGYMVSHSQEHEHYYYNELPPPFHSQHHHRYVPQQNQTPLHHPLQQQPQDLYPTACLLDAGAGAGAWTGAGGGLLAFPPGCSSSHSSGHGSGHSSPAQMDLLMKENEMLRRELEGYNEKAARLQKLELEIQRISEAYETLMKGSAKRETLEKTMRNKLEAEIKRMHDFNRDLRERLDTATKRRVAEEVESTDQKQHILAKLLEQNEEQQRERERLERELLHLRSSGEERLLALGSARARNRQLEEELRRKRAYVEKVERLQSSLAALQAACEKRESLELRLRTRLEQELKNLRALQWRSRAASDPSEPCFPTVQQQQLREREERILALEADITKWEQKYLEESTMRQFAMDAAATAAAQRDTTIINHSPGHSPNNSFNDHLPLANYKHQEMENRIRALHAQLLEKDAVIKVLQQRSKLRPARSVPSIATTTAGPCNHSSRGKVVKSLSDDQTTTVSAVTTTTTTTAAAGDPLPPLPGEGRLPVQKAPSRDCSTQWDGSLEEAAVTPSTLAPSLAGSMLIPENNEPLEENSLTSDVSKDADASDAELVEILI